MNEKMIDQMFLNRFAGGIEDIEFLEMAKKHRSSDKILELAKSLELDDFISASSLKRQAQIDILLQMVQRSTMISTFEKMAFKNYMSNREMHSIFLSSLRSLLLDNSVHTFNDFVDVLLMQKHAYNANIAKWPIITFLLLYNSPYEEVFVKPTTIKKVAAFLQVDIAYTSLPNFETYRLIRSMVMNYKSSSQLCDHQTNITVQAIMYCAIY